MMLLLLLPLAVRRALDITLSTSNRCVGRPIITDGYERLRGVLGHFRRLPTMTGQRLGGAGRVAAGRAGSHGEALGHATT